MGCSVIPTPGGGTAFLCGGRGSKRCTAPGCSKRAPILCDWILDHARKRTCSRPICRDHAYQPDPKQDKHLCGPHRRAYEEWKRGHTNP